MILKGLIDEDFANYKLPSMFLAFPTCTWKCEKECGFKCCQNEELAKSPDIEVSAENIIERYLKNPITKAIVCGGLEPLDSWDFLKDFLEKFRKKSGDVVVIYTGYKRQEVKEIINELMAFDNIVVKLGRYVPNSTSYYNEDLGVMLASQNQSTMSRIGKTFRGESVNSVTTGEFYSINNFTASNLKVMRMEKK